VSGTPEAAAYFDGRSTLYDAQYDAPTAHGYALRSRLAVVRGLLGPGPGRLLDAGMGAGRLLADLEAAGWTVSGIDASQAMVEAARRRLTAAADRLLQAEIEALPFPDEAFDAVVATGVLEYADLRGALAELARVLRPGGVAVVSYPNPRALYGLWKSRIHYGVLRGLKRVARRPEPWLPRGGPAVGRDRFAGLLAGAGLSLQAVEHASYLVIPSPLERHASGAAPVLATQLVYASRKPPPAGGRPRGGAALV
jgi:SAM-dependent methyltransferase